MTALEHDGTATCTKPRLILMGEFSAGKSTLTNILLGGTPLPMQVTATRLPPVHISYGEPAAAIIDRDGICHDIALADLSHAQPAHTRSIHLTLASDLLDLCDIVDMPGISDPNMPADTWDSVVKETDIVIWCTHATQAWRQSEAAIWDRIRPATSGNNLLLINQIDKLRAPRDKVRVLKRVRREVRGKFTAIYPISLLQALNAEDDFEAWQACGADAFMTHLIEIILGSAGTAEGEAIDQPADGAAIGAPEDEQGDDKADLDDAFALSPQYIETSYVQNDNGAIGTDHNIVHFGRPVTPRRVQAKVSGQDRPLTPRQTNHDADALGFLARSEQT